MADPRLAEVAAELLTITNVLLEIVEENTETLIVEEADTRNTYSGPGYPRITEAGEGVRRVEFNESESVLVEERYLKAIGSDTRPYYYPGVAYIPETEEQPARYDFHFLPGYVVMVLADRIDTDHPDAVGITAGHQIREIRNRLDHWTVQ